MTNHIEELMKAAGVRKKKKSGYCCEFYSKGFCIKFKHGCKLGEEECSWDSYNPCYPAFTPAKQLELIKLILKGSKTYNLELEYVGVCDHYCFSWFDATVTYDDCITVNNKCYELALAELVYTLINENKLDKSEVKRILEDDN